MTERGLRHRIAIVEDDVSLRENIAAFVDGKSGCEVLFAVGTAEEGLERLEQAVPDVLIVDLGLPGASGLELIQQVRERNLPTDIIVLTIYEDDENVFRALSSGAVGYLTKTVPPSAILKAIEEVRSGGAPMSPAIARRVVNKLSGREPDDAAPMYENRLTGRESEVLELLARGYTYLNVGVKLGISTHTVHAHIRKIYKKLQVNSRSEAVYKAVRQGLVEL
jgi:DNA-binding NarL/FixJ family response regulator